MTAVAGRAGPGFLPPRTTSAHCMEGTEPGVMPEWPADLSSLPSPLCPSFSLLLLSYPFCSTLQFFIFIAVQFLHFLFLPILCSHPPFIWLTCPQHPGEFMGSATRSPMCPHRLSFTLYVHLSASRFKSKLMRAKPCLTWLFLSGALCQIWPRSLSAFVEYYPVWNILVRF